MILSDLKRFYDLTRSNKCLNVYWVSCACLYVKPLAPASPDAQDKMKRLTEDIDERFPELSYELRPGNMIRVVVR